MFARSNLIAIAANSIFWVGLVAIVSSLLGAKIEFFSLFLIVLAGNVLFIVALKMFMPRLFSALFEIPSIVHKASSLLTFKFVPKAYPKSFDSEANSYYPEFVRVEIGSEGKAVFKGDVPRKMLLSFRDTISNVLNMKDVQEKQEAKVVSAESR